MSSLAGSAPIPYADVFANIRNLGKRKLTYIQDFSGRKRTIAYGSEIVGDEILRGKLFRRYVKLRMAHVPLLRRGVTHAQFKSSADKRSLCNDSFSLDHKNSFFYKLLVRNFGNDFTNLERRRSGVTYIGKPGAQGIAILVEDDAGVPYIYKLARFDPAKEGQHKNNTLAGTGIGLVSRNDQRRSRATNGVYEAGSGNMLGLIAQAKMQMIAAMQGCAPPVYACAASDRNQMPVSYIVMPPMRRLLREYQEELETTHGEEVARSIVFAKTWNLALKMDTHVGINHDDQKFNNIMQDFDGEILLIDFDFSSFVDHLSMSKNGKFLNLYLGNGYFYGVNKQTYEMWRDRFRPLRYNSEIEPMEVPSLPAASYWPTWLSWKEQQLLLNNPRYANLRF